MMSRLASVRLAVVAAAAASIAVTWPLWQVRSEPPLLPLCELPQVPFAAPLLASLALALRWPVLGAAIHSVLLAVAMLLDQTREQPQFVSFAILLWATTPLAGASAVGVLHLGALWAWSGLGKLASPGFLVGGGSWLLGAGGEPSSAGTALAVLVGLGELALGLAVLCGRRHAFVVWAAVSLHLGILAFLVVRGENAAVWAWNAALAFCAPRLLREVPARGLFGPGVLAPRIAAVAFVVLPIGFHLGFVDAPFAMQVYTQNTPRAVRLGGSAGVEAIVYVEDLRVPLPPVPRVQRQWFAAVGARGERLALLEPRPLARWLGARDQLLEGGR